MRLGLGSLGTRLHVWQVRQTHRDQLICYTRHDSGLSYCNNRPVTIGDFGMCYCLCLVTIFLEYTCSLVMFLVYSSLVSLLVTPCRLFVPCIVPWLCVTDYLSPYIVSHAHALHMFPYILYISCTNCVNKSCWSFGEQLPCGVVTLLLNTNQLAKTQFRQENDSFLKWS